MSCSWQVILPTLQSVPTVSSTIGSTSRAKPSATGMFFGGFRTSRISRPSFLRLRRRTGSSPMKVCSPLQMSQPAFERRLAAPRCHASGQLPAHRRDADQDGVGLERESRRPCRATTGNAVAESEHVARGLAGGHVIDDPDHPFRQVPDHGVGGLRRHRVEIAVGEDQEALGSHGSVTAVAMVYIIVF